MDSLQPLDDEMRSKMAVLDESFQKSLSTELLTEWSTSSAPDASAVMREISTSMPEGDAKDLMILFLDLSQTLVSFELAAQDVEDYVEDGDTAKAVLKGATSEETRPLRFRKIDGHWKIDAIGTDESLQEQFRKAVPTPPENAESPTNNPR